MASELANLNTLDFYLWGLLKSVLSVTAVNDVVDLLQRVADGNQLFQKIPGMFERVLHTSPYALCSV
jgi:hypothetical protein